MTVCISRLELTADTHLHARALTRTGVTGVWRPPWPAKLCAKSIDCPAGAWPVQQLCYWSSRRAHSAQLCGQRMACPAVVLLVSTQFKALSYFEHGVSGTCTPACHILVFLKTVVAHGTRHPAVRLLMT